MTNSKQRRKFIFTSFLVFSFITTGLPLRAQDVVTSDDFVGGSSAFIFKASSRKSRTAPVRVNTSISRTKTAKLESLKRIVKQVVIVAKISPKRVKSKEINIETTKIDTVALSRKSPKEASVVFAGVGEYYLSQGDTDKAVEWFRESAQLDAKNGNAKTGLSEALTRKGDFVLEKENYDVAKLLYDEALANNTKNAGAYAGLAAIYSAKDDRENAVLNYEKALSLDKDLTELNAPLGVLYYQKGDFVKAETYLQKALAVNTENAETQFFNGLLKLKAERYAEAAAAFKHSLQLDATNAEAQYYLGETLDHLNNDAEALTAYQAAVAINPRYADAWSAIGTQQLAAKHLTEATNAFKEAIKINPRLGDAHAGLADAYRLQNMLDEAIGEYRQATTFIKDDAEIYSKYGYVAARRAITPGYQNFWKTAIENFEKAIAVSPDKPQSIDYSNLGWAYYNLAQYHTTVPNDPEFTGYLTKAKDALTKANTLKPVSVVAAAINLNLGMTLTDLKDFPGSLAALKSANDLRQNWLPALNELGIAYSATNDLNAAAEQFKKALKIDDKFASAHYNLGITEFRRNNMKEAKKEYEILKKLNQKYYVSRFEIETRGAIKK